MPARHHKACRAEHGGRAQNCADVVRVGDLIEHEQRTAVGVLGEFDELGFGQVFGFQHRHPDGRCRPREFGRDRAASRIRPDVQQRPHRFDHAALGVFGQHQPQ